jgi:hypothetical protein
MIRGRGVCGCFGFCFVVVVEQLGLESERENQITMYNRSIWFSDPPSPVVSHHLSLLKILPGSSVTGI